MITTSGPPERHRSTGIDVLVVGAGLGGLVAAVELYRHGHEVRIIESKSQMDQLGMIRFAGDYATSGHAELTTAR